MSKEEFLKSCKNIYSISLGTAEKLTLVEYFPYVEPLPQPGEQYEFATMTLALENKVYGVGDVIVVLKRFTNPFEEGYISPHGRRSSLGNLLIKHKKHISIWTCVESLIYTGILIQLEKPKYENT